MNWNKIATIVGLLIALGSAYAAIDTHYAKAADVKVI